MEPRALFCGALVSYLQVELGHPNLYWLIGDLDEGQPDWWPLYDLRPQFYAYAEMIFEGGKVNTRWFAPIRKSRRRNGNLA
jgi:hypothetical protein